jgi:geranylgeranyl pyrophosphate synthase
MFTHFQEYAAEVRPALEAAFRRRLTFLLGEGDPLHGEAGLCLTGGKQIRGLLVCLVNAALGGSLEAALPRAVAVELIQAATLVHDDFVDQHRRRRNRPAFWTLAGARRAVLLGDIVFSSAIQMMSELGREDCRIVSGAIADLSRGAWHEPLNAAALLERLDGNERGPIDYERIISLKTGILFAAACQLGAAAAGAAPPLQQRWRRYGQSIGEAYQLADDIQEMKRVLAGETLDADHLADLAPALLYFVPLSRTPVMRALRSGKTASAAELLLPIREAVGRMVTDRERRLRQAIAELEGIVPEGTLAFLVRRAPADLIEMFDRESLPAE